MNLQKCHMDLQPILASAPAALALIPRLADISTHSSLRKNVASQLELIEKTPPGTDLHRTAVAHGEFLMKQLSAKQRRSIERTRDGVGVFLALLLAFGCTYWSWRLLARDDAWQWATIATSTLAFAGWIVLPGELVGKTPDEREAEEEKKRKKKEEKRNRKK